LVPGDLDVVDSGRLPLRQQQGCRLRWLVAGVVLSDIAGDRSLRSTFV
jgi:hypothetical protein